MEYAAYDMTGLATLVRKGQTTPEELLDAALSRMSEVNSCLTAVVSVFEDVARRRIAKGLPEGTFHGVPFLLKDCGCEAVDYPATDGSRLLADSTSPVDSALFERLTATGLVPFGRTAVPENAIGVATEAAIYGAPTRNPWDQTRTPGGSSGGSAAAVAAGIVPGAHGSDGGGSVRIPASCTGLFGFKPTRARLPDGPLAGEGWGGLAIDGFLTRTVRDTAALIDACEGPDPGAPYSAPPLTAPLAAAIETDPGRLRIALCDTTFTGEPVHPDCHAAVHDAARLLADMGHRVTPARPDADHRAMMIAWTDIVACGTALTVRTELIAKGRELQPSDLEGVSLGALEHAKRLNGADYLAAVATIHRYARSMARFFAKWDILLTPTLAEPPAEIGRFNHETEDYVEFRLGEGGCFSFSPFTAAFNATGQPAMSVPLHWTKEGLPIGVHLAAPFGEDERLMSLAADLERARPWFHRRPPLLASSTYSC